MVFIKDGFLEDQNRYNQRIGGRMVRTLLFCMILFSSTLIGGNRAQNSAGKPILGGEPSRTLSPQEVGGIQNESPGVSIVQGEKNTNWDYQTNGADERHLWVLPDGTVHAVYWGNTGTITGASGEALRSYYAYSPDSGRTFIKPVAVEAEIANCPAMAVTPDGRVLVASSRGKSPYGISIHADSSRGSGKFTLFKTPEIPKNGVYPQLSVVSESLAVFIGMSLKTKENIWNVFNFKTNTFLHETNLVAFTGIKNKIGITVTSNRSGKVAMVVPNWCGFPLSGVAGENNIWVRESLDGGVTWCEPIQITRLFSDTMGTQTVLGNTSALYVGDELHVVWQEWVIPKNGEYVDGLERIIHWAKGVNDGWPTIAVKWDSLHFGPKYMYGTIGIPRIGRDEDGILTIVFQSCYNDPQHHGAYGLNYWDISAVSSADNGLTWGEPTNLTNAARIDDDYPYISEWNQSGKINILYQTDTQCGEVRNGGQQFVGKVDHLFLQTDHPSTVPYDTEPYPEDPVDPINGLVEKDSPIAQPDHFALEQNFPNPFNPSTTIMYSLAQKGFVSMKIHDLLGREIRTLVTGNQAAGSHRVEWDGLNDRGLQVPSGIYFYTLTTKGFRETRKLVMLR
jgi:hypothetical protein